GRFTHDPEAVEPEDAAQHRGRGPERLPSIGQWPVVTTGFDDGEPAAHGFPVAAQSSRPRSAVRRNRISRNPVVAEPAHPSADRGRPSDAGEGEPVTGDEVDRGSDVVGRQRVAYRLFGGPG